MPEINIALIGHRFMGKAHSNAYRQVRRFFPGKLVPRLKVICGRDEAALADAARQFGWEETETDWRRVIERKDIEVVDVSTPGHLHHPMAIASARAGKHVICEKPLAMTSQETAELVALAERTKLAAAVCYNVRFYPLCLEARQRIAAGELGKLYHVVGSYVQDWLLYDTDFNWRVMAEEGGALRAVADIGTHWLDLMMWITGRKVTEVCADLATVVPVRQRQRGRVETFQKAGNMERDDVPITTDDYASVLLHFEDDLRGVMTVSQVSAGRKARLWFEIDGTKGSLAWNSESPNRLWVGRRDRASEMLPKDPALLSPPARGYAAYPGGHAEGYPDTFVQLFREFYEYVAAANFDAPRPFPTFANGNHELILCEAIAKSAQDRRWFEVLSD